MGNFCQNCGKALEEGAKFCGSCGKETEPRNQRPHYNQGYYALQRNIIAEASQKIKTDGIIWLVIACFQYLIGLCSILSGYGIVVIFIAVLNTVSAVQDFKYSEQILERPVGLVSKYEPISGRIINLVYNVIFGGLIGVIGSIYGFVLRNFIVQNKMEFLNIEQQYAMR